MMSAQFLTGMQQKTELLSEGLSTTELRCSLKWIRSVWASVLVSTTIILELSSFFHAEAMVVGGKYIDAKKEIALIEAQGKVLSDVQKNTIYAIEKIQTGGKDFDRELAKQEFDSLEINEQKITQGDLQQWAKTPREKKPLETKIYRDRFIITDVHFEHDTTYIDVKNAQDEKVIKYVNILAELVSEDDYQWFKDSANRQPIDMTIVSTEKQGKIMAAYLQSFKK